MRRVRRPFNICFYLYFLLAALFRQVLNSVCSPGWPLTCSPPTFTYVALASSGSSPGSTSKLLGLFVCATTSDFILLNVERSLDLHQSWRNTQLYLLDSHSTFPGQLAFCYHPSEKPGPRHTFLLNTGQWPGQQSCTGQAGRCLSHH